MSLDFNFNVTSWFLGNVHINPYLNTHPIHTPHPPCTPQPQSAYLCPRCLCCIPPYHHYQGRKMKIFSLAFFVTPECHTPLQCQRSMNSNLSSRAISRTKVSKLLPLYPILTILYPILTILLSQLHQFNNSFDRIVKSLEELLETSLFCNDFSHFYFILCFQTND